MVWVSPRLCKIFGEINADFIPTNAEKNFFEVNSPEYVAAIEAFREYAKKYLAFVKAKRETA